MEEKREKTWYLYMLVCSDGTFYTGITNDIARRIARHNAGTASRYTRVRRPVTLLLKRRCKSRSDALKKEYAMKQLTRNEKERYLKKYGTRRSKKISV